MSYLEKTDLNTHLRDYNIATISGGDETILEQAISGAIAEVKGYLGAFDCTVIFNKTAADRDPLVLKITKDVAVWHFLTLMNAGTEMEYRKEVYLIARDWLKAVQKGNIAPDLPKVEDKDGNNTGARVASGSNEKRKNHF